MHNKNERLLRNEIKRMQYLAKKKGYRILKERGQDQFRIYARKDALVNEGKLLSLSQCWQFLK